MLRKSFFLLLIAGGVTILSSFIPGMPVKPEKQALKTIIIDAGHGGPDPGAEGSYSTEADLNLALALKLGKKLEEALPECKIVYTRKDGNLPGNTQNPHLANRLRAQMANEAKGDLFISIHINYTNAKYRSEVVGYETKTYYVKGKGGKKVKKTKKVPIVKRYKIPPTVAGTETYIWAMNKNDSKKQFVGGNLEMDTESGEKADSTYEYFDSPEAKIMASLRTKKYFDYSYAIASYVEDEFVKSGRESRGVKQRDNEGIWVLQATAMPSILVEAGFLCTQSEEDYMNSEKGQQEITDCIKNAVLRYKSYLTNGDTNAAVPQTASNNK